MPQSLSNVLLHIVFSTKNRQTYLKSPQIRQELFAYMAGTLQEIDSPALLINGVEDHIHILNVLSRNLAIAKLIEKIKSSSSKWIKQKGPAYRSFFWQAGYGAFSVSESQKEVVLRYIANQEQHHRRQSFQDEFRELCRRHGLAIDERYVWD
jgi:REP element-mobilizing transposase RayT